MDGTLVGLAVAVGVLVTAGLAASGLVDRAAPSGRQLTLDAAAALVPVAGALVLLRRPGDRGLRVLTLALGLMGLVIVATGIGERPSAAPLAISPVLVLVACQPRVSLVLPRWWRPAGGGVLAVVLVVGLLMSPGRPGAGDPLYLVSGRLGDGQEAIGVADARFLSDTLGIADRVAGARCYFVADGEVYADVVACGPVVHSREPETTGETGEGLGETGGSGDGLGEDSGDSGGSGGGLGEGSGDSGDSGGAGDGLGEDSGDGLGESGDTGGFEDEGAISQIGTGVWDVYPVRAEGGELGLAGDPALGQEVERSLLHRPDGLRPPEDVPEEGGVGLTVDPGFAVVLFEEPGGARPTRGFVLAGSGRVAVEAVARPSTVTDGDGFEREAPDGYRLVAFHLAFEEVVGTTVEVVSGSDRVDVTGIVSDGGDAYQDGWLVAVDRDDGIDPLLEVTYRGRSQRISLETGERLGGHPLLYRPREQAVDLPVESATVPVTVPRPTPHPAEVDMTSYTIDRADLVVFDQNLGWAPPGQAWLVVTLSGLGSPSFSDSDIHSDVEADPIFRFDAAGSFRLRLAGDTELTPVGVRPTTDGDPAAVFSVSEDTRTATFRSAPRWLLSLGQDGIEVTAPAVEVPLSL